MILAAHTSVNALNAFNFVQGSDAALAAKSELHKALQSAYEEEKKKLSALMN